MKGLFVSIILLTGAASFDTSAQTVTDIDLTGLHSTFNSLQGTARMIFIGDPTCPACIASAGDIKNYIFNVCDNPDLRGLIVWVHMSGYPSTRNDAVAQSASWSDPRVAFYWDSLWDISYAFGYQGGWAGCNWAWDISMIYTDSTMWTGTYPPAPYHCMSKTGCCDVWNIINQRNQLYGLGECMATAIEEHLPLQPGLNVSPNPVSDFITLNDKTENTPVQIQVISILGHSIIESRNQNRVDVSFLQPGIYFLRIKQDNKIYSRRFVKK